MDTRVGSCSCRVWALEYPDKKVCKMREEEEGESLHLKVMNQISYGSVHLFFRIYMCTNSSIIAS